MALLGPSAVRADWNAFKQRSAVDYHRNNCWPQPFNRMDQRVVCQTFSLQIAKGWQRQNTLGDDYFDTETQVLNESGRRKLWSILTATPEQYRAVYVVRSMNSEASDRRLESVQRFTTEMLAGQEPPQVIAVSVSPRSWSGEYTDAIDRQVLQTIPPPRLAPMVSTSSN
jgi:hypothetical protein